MTEATRDPHPRVELFGIPIAALTMDETVQRARAMVLDGASHQHVVVNAAKVVAIDRDATLAEAVRSCDLVNADGASVVWASRLLRRPLPERVAGIDLFERLVEAAAMDGHPVYFLGGRQDVVTEVVRVFEARYPSLKVAGYHDGYWDDDAEPALVEAIREARPAYLFLAIPSPRKELWLNHYRQELSIPFVMGVGGSFDVIAGRVSRAPSAVQRAGMEWAWRLAQEPRRMWRRYLFGNLAFLRITLRELGRARS